MAAASTLATLLIRLGFDITGLNAGGAAAQGQLGSVAQSANAAAAAVRGVGAAAQAAAAQVAQAQVVLNGAARGAGGRFVSPGVMLQQNAAAGAAAANQMAAATNTATAATVGLNSALSTTKLLLASFIVLGFIQFVAGAAGAASEFQSEMLLLRTQARATMTEVRQMTAAVMAMAPAVRTGPEELAKGLYHIESVGLRGARALEVLTAAAQGARVGNANLEDVTNALVASVTSGIKGITSMSKAMGVLDGIVGSGNMRMEQLSKAMASGVLATAKAFGISIQDVGAALAAMTDQGIPAEEAATRLRITIALIGAPTIIAAQQLSRIGLSSRDLADQMRGPDGLIGALEMLQDHLQRSGLDLTEQSQLLKAAFGGSRSSSGLLTLIGSIDLLHLKMKTITAAEADFGQVAKLQGETAAAKFQTLGAIVEVLAINVGNVLLPVLIVLAGVLGFIFSQTIPLTIAITALVAILTILALKVAASFVLAAYQMVAAMGVQLLTTLGLTAANWALFTAEVAAATASGGLVAGLAVIAAAVAIPLAAIVAIGVAIALLVLNFDRVAQGIRLLEYAFVGAVKGIIDTASLLPFVGDSFKGLSQGLQESLDGIAREMAAAEGDIAAKARAMDNAAGNVDPAGLLADKVAAGTDQIIDETKTMVEIFGTSIQGVEKAAGAAGAKAMAEMATEIRKHQNDPLDAFIELVDMLQHSLDPAVEIARLYGMLISQELAAGLANGDAAVVAQAQATQKYIIDRLDELTNGAYSAGQNAIIALNKGMDSVQIDPMPHYGPDGKELAGPFLTSASKMKAAWDAVKPSASAVADAMKSVNDQLNKTARADGLRALNSAFSDISSSAHKFFEEMHSRNLQLIEDANKHKNALLDVKKALNQAPVTAAQKALDFQRDAITEWRLREDISKANGPEAYRDAVMALQDFLAQQHINQMQDQVDAANDRIDKQKSANDTAAEAAKRAEDARYENQKASFDRQLEQLRSYLEKHPGEWQRTEEKILKLLAGYGLSYKSAGATLGGYFVEGLQSQVAAAVAAAKAMAGAMATVNDLGNDFHTGAPSSGGTHGWDFMGGGGYVPGLASGSWQILKDNMLARLHKDELVAPADAADIMRQFGSKRLTPGSSALPTSGSNGGGTIVVQIGEERVADIIDHRMSIQEDIYSSGMRLSTGSMR